MTWPIYFLIGILIVIFACYQEYNSTGYITLGNILLSLFAWPIILFAFLYMLFFENADKEIFRKK